MAREFPPECTHVGCLHYTRDYAIKAAVAEESEHDAAPCCSEGWVIEPAVKPLLPLRTPKPWIWHD